jgi:hypothetical protein
VVFLWYITQGRLGGPSFAPDRAPAIIERVARALLKRGCVVGFGDPDSAEWNVPIELDVPNEKKAVRIAKLWMEDPKRFESLVFARRS